MGHASKQASKQPEKESEGWVSVGEESFVVERLAHRYISGDSSESPTGGKSGDLGKARYVRSNSRCHSLRLSRRKAMRHDANEELWCDS
jgi:hypothetical protein